ncbi:MAG: polymerase [Pseudomonadota bacterium]|nr:polymerase [Pseudomonadota bacterium]
MSLSAASSASPSEPRAIPGNLAVPIFALVDCNNFYASCEKLFNPKLKHRPVVVLSNNDGCVVARSAEVKALGIPMGVPWFQIRDQARRHGIVAFSSNYALYADMSNRVVQVLAGFSPNLEVYSIDESFLDLSGFTGQADSLAAYGAEIRQRVADWLGLAVCVGIAPTKTLAKLANHCAKKDRFGTGGVCDFTTASPAALDALFERVEAGEVWGVGRKITSRLQAMGIHTVRQLRDANAETIRARFSVVLERTVRELRGDSCMDMEEVAPNKQQIMSSRSFGHLIHDLDKLEEAVASYIAKAAEKLRAQASLAGAVQVYLRTNIFKPEVPQYQPAVTVPLPEATSDTRTLTQWALKILRAIYRPGFGYHKAGVMLLDLSPQAKRQFSLFDAQGVAEGVRSEKLMDVLDSINLRYGRHTLRLGAEGVAQDWQMRRENLSPGYTTSWEGVPVVGAR